MHLEWYQKTSHRRPYVTSLLTFTKGKSQLGLQWPLRLSLDISDALRSGHITLISH